MRSSGTSSQDNPIWLAFRKVNRADFVPDSLLERADQNVPLPIGYGQTISQPSTVSFMLELLDPKPGQRVLDIGSGSGWTTALLSAIVGESGSVTGLEIVPELVAFGRTNIGKYRFRNAEILLAGKEIGIPGRQFDRILVSAAAETLPRELPDQLAEGGRLVIPIGNSVFLFEKTPDGLKSTESRGFLFVPLVVDGNRPNLFAKRSLWPNRRRALAETESKAAFIR